VIASGKHEKGEGHGPALTTISLEQKKPMPLRRGSRRAGFWLAKSVEKLLGEKQKSSKINEKSIRGGKGKSLEKSGHSIWLLKRKPGKESRKTVHEPRSGQGREGESLARRSKCALINVFLEREKTENSPKPTLETEASNREKQKSFNRKATSSKKKREGPP